MPDIQETDLGRELVITRLDALYRKRMSLRLEYFNDCELETGNKKKIEGIEKEEAELEQRLKRLLTKTIPYNIPYARMGEYLEYVNHCGQWEYETWLGAIEELEADARAEQEGAE